MNSDLLLSTLFLFKDLQDANHSVIDGDRYEDGHKIQLSYSEEADDEEDCFESM